MSISRTAAVLLLLFPATNYGQMTAKDSIKDEPLRMDRYPAVTHPVFRVNYKNPTADKPQSKLWYAGESWWALLPTSTGPCLWQRTKDGWKEHAYAAEQLAGISGRADVWPEKNRVLAAAVKELKVNRSISVFLLDMKKSARGICWQAKTVAELYPPCPDETIETATIIRDGKGRWWVAAVAGTTVYVWSSPANGRRWTCTALAQGVHRDDICVVTPLADGEIGVLWSDQVRDAVLLRVHRDKNPSEQWDAEQVIDQGHRTADDHLNTALSPDGTLWLATKNSVDQVGKPQFVLRVRSRTGRWTNIPYVIKGERQWQSRPIVMATQDPGVVFSAYGGSELAPPLLRHPVIVCSLIDTTRAAILKEPHVVISPDSACSQSVQNVTGPRHAFPAKAPWIILASDSEGRVYEADVSRLVQ
ncbi:MAG TPA: hypothetical protein PK843_14315 [bacterium]|nr:hypothetical protein [bacterium]